MYIPQPSLDQNDVANLVSDLKQLINQPTAKQSPPCPNCAKEDIIDWTRNNCSAKCVRAPYALSEDRDLYPIEEHVVPLVFELTTMRIVQTCWSCEGHINIDGEIWKYPQVSFYTNKPIYSQLICNYLADLHINKKLKYPWEVVLSNYGRTWDVTYTIKCDLNRISKPSIYAMQNDLLIMADGLSDKIKVEANNLIKDIEVNKMYILQVEEV